MSAAKSISDEPKKKHATGWTYKRYSGPAEYLKEHSIPRLKITMCGEAGVGKTTFTQRIARGQFCENSPSTIGVDYHQEYVDINGSAVQLQLQDTAGQERFALVVSSYFRDADAVVIFFDSCDKKSYIMAASWRKRVTDENPGAVCMLVATKGDLYEKKHAKSDDWLARMKPETHAVELECQWGYFLTSAKTGNNVLEALARIAYLAWNKRQREMQAELEADRRHKGRPGEVIQINVSNTNRPTSISCCGN